MSSVFFFKIRRVARLRISPERFRKDGYSFSKGAGQDPAISGTDVFWTKKHILQTELRENTLLPVMREDSINMNDFFGMK